MIKRMFQKLVPKVVAIGIVSLLVAWTLHVYCVKQLTELYSTSTFDFLDQERRGLSMTWLEVYLSILPLGALYVLLVESVAAIVRALLPHQNDLMRNETPAA